jgi:hypothetical protein
MARPYKEGWTAMTDDGTLHWLALDGQLDPMLGRIET